jgi:hypothetical protein
VGPVLNGRDEMSHWTKKLPEAGTDSFAREAADIDNRIEQLQAQIDALYAVRQNLEDQAMRWAKKYWSDYEISAAIEAANN